MIRLMVGAFLFGGVWLQQTPALQSADQAYTLPPNFAMRTVVSGLQFPTDMAVLPSGDILVTEKGSGSGQKGIAQVRLVHQGTLVPEPVMTLDVTVEGDSGIYSIVLDPNFATNYYFYVWYSIGADSIEWKGQSVDRLSRFTFDPLTGRADALDETIILDGIPWSIWHNCGGIAFDDAGNLFVATGDAANSALGQEMDTLNGKLLRIRPNATGGYSVPSDNPFVDKQPEIRPEIYASGLRNPFRMARRPDEQAFYLIDVGYNSWEEVNRVEAAANYGWAVREGPCPVNVNEPNCPPAPPIFTEPVVTYAHPPEEGAGISGLAFYTGSVWPAPYQGNLFFADFNAHSISMVDLDNPKTIIPFGDEIGNLVDIEATPEGLYLLSIYEGAIRFIYYSESGNQWPTAQMSATPQQGAAPLQVNFSAAGSTDPEQDALTYQWTFGDGSAPVTSAQPVLTHSYASDGDYTATLQVVDAFGGKSELLTKVIQVYSGAMPSIGQAIVGAAGRDLYRGGDEVRFSATRVGGKEGLDATRPYVWSITQHHNQHVHFIVTEFAADETGMQIANDSHAAEASLWYEAELTMYTSMGQAIRVTRDLLPDVVELDVRSLPGRVEMRWNGVLQPAGQPIAAIVGQTFTLEAPEILYYGAAKYQFANWQITTPGNSGTEQTITERSFELIVGTEAKSYVAHYTFLTEAYVSYLPSATGSAAQK